MSMHKCPRCQQYYVVDFMVTDVIHSCHTASITLTQEDVPLLGSWVDYTGSGTNSSSISTTGIDNTLQFSDAWIVDKETNTTRTSRGNRTSTHRTRMHQEYQEIGV